MVTLLFFVLFFLHWQVSVFLQTFFLHRYGAHRQFTMSKGWEKAFHLLTFVVQGPSYLNPRAYAILHRMHHAYSDTPSDPHSPIHQPNFFKMMWRTKAEYEDVKYRRVAVDPRFEGGYPRVAAPRRQALEHDARVAGAPSTRSSTSRSPRTGGSSCSCPSTGSWAPFTAPSSTGRATRSDTGTTTATTTRRTRSSSTC